MPVQINEMIIRAHVHEPEQKPAEKKTQGGNADKEEIIRECTEAVLEILKHNQER